MLIYFLKECLCSLYLCDSSSSEFNHYGGGAYQSLSPYDNHKYHLTFNKIGSVPFIFKKINLFTSKSDLITFDHVREPGGYRMKVGLHFLCFDGTETPIICPTRREQTLWSMVDTSDGIAICTSMPYLATSLIVERNYCLTIDDNVSQNYKKSLDSFPVKIRFKQYNYENQQFILNHEDGY